MAVVYQQPAAPSSVLDSCGLDVNMTDKSLEDMDFETIQTILFDPAYDDDDIASSQTQKNCHTVFQLSHDIDIFSYNLDKSLNEADLSGQEDDSEHDFKGFGVSDIHMSRDKCTKFTSFMDNWFFDFNAHQLWQGRNYQNIQHVLNAGNHRNFRDHNCFVDFPLRPKYVEPTEYWYQILACSSQRGKDQLFDSESHIYNCKFLLDNYVSTKKIWRCARNRKNKGFNNCSAEVHIFTKGDREGSYIRVGTHNHEPRYTLDEVLLMKELRHEAITDRYSKASHVVDRLIAQRNIFVDKFRVASTTGCLTYLNLTRIVYRIRAKLCPPKEYRLHFEINYTFIPNMFCQRDIVMGDERFIFF